MDWYRIDIVAGASPSVSDLNVDVQNCHNKHGQERGFAVFEAKTPKDFATTLYLPKFMDRFCPDVREKYEAYECEKPLLEDVELIHGQKDAIRQYFG